MQGLEYEQTMSHLAQMNTSLQIYNGDEFAVTQGTCSGTSLLMYAYPKTHTVHHSHAFHAFKWNDGYISRFCRS